MILTGALTMLAKGALTAVVGPFVAEARDAALNAAQDTLRTTVAGKMSIEEWAKIISEGADNVKEKVITENDFRFVGGKLTMMFSENNPKVVAASFQLYFLDEQEQWQMAAAETDLPASKFTMSALDELALKKEITYEVE